MFIRTLYIVMLLTSALGFYVLGAMIDGIIGLAGEVITGVIAVFFGVVVWGALWPWLPKFE